MTRLTATEARRQFFRLLDAAQRGEGIEFERDGVRFRITLIETQTGAAPPARIVTADPAVLSGEWTWAFDDTGNLVFVEDQRETE